MKKSILLVTLFLTASLTSSNAAVLLDSYSDCAQEAWEHGTKMAKNDKWDDNSEYLQWYYTEQFYNDYCE